MKLLLLTFAIFAFAAAELHWDKNGEYRVVDDESLAVVEPALLEPKVIDPKVIEPKLTAYKYDYFPFPPFYQKQPFPVAYPAIDGRFALALKAYKPFFYDYKQVKSLK